MACDVVWYTGPSILEESPALVFRVKTRTIKMESAGFS